MTADLHLSIFVDPATVIHMQKHSQFNELEVVGKVSFQYGSAAAIAEGLGHRAIYKNYEVVAGDAYCPVTLDQLALVLLAHKKSHIRVQNFVRLLLKVEDSTTRADLRKTIATVTHIPEETLDKFPLAAFSGADQQLFHLIRNAALEMSGDRMESNDVSVLIL